MVAKKYYDTLLKITDVMAEYGGSVQEDEDLGEETKKSAKKPDKYKNIKYIRNEPDCYTVGTEWYADEIAQCLDESVDDWTGEEATLKKKSKKRSKKQDKIEELYYLWKINLPDN